MPLRNNGAGHTNLSRAAARARLLRLPLTPSDSQKSVGVSRPLERLRHQRLGDFISHVHTKYFAVLSAGTQCPGTFYPRALMAHFHYTASLSLARCG